MHLPAANHNPTATLAFVVHHHGTAQRSTARHGTAQHSTAQHSTAQRSTAQHSTARHGTAQHGKAQHSTAQPSAAEPSTAQHGTAQHSTAQRSKYPGAPHVREPVAHDAVEAVLRPLASPAHVRGKPSGPVDGELRLRHRALDAAEGVVELHGREG